MGSTDPLCPELDGHILVILDGWDDFALFLRIRNWLVCILPDRLMVEGLLRSDREAFLVVFDTVDMDVLISRRALLLTLFVCHFSILLPSLCDFLFSHFWILWLIV